MKQLFLICGFVLLYSNLFGSKTICLTVDPTVTIGKIRTLNGGTLSPVANNKLLDLREEFSALKIPCVRLHDAPWLNDYVVDIHTIFPNFDLDPLDPENYDFRKTDDFMREIVQMGTQVIFRLGESIEHTERKFYVNPPKDSNKWAEICAAIVRHYNREWADGFSYGIRYWEIWNEPDIDKMWTGTDLEFFNLFEITSKRLREEFTDILIGGPSLSDPLSDLLNPKPYLMEFLKHMKNNHVPLDFFSWHNYNTDPQDLARRVDVVRKVLDKEGFKRIQMHLNEWNYIPDNDWSSIYEKGTQGMRRRNFYERQFGTEGAAFVASVLILLQDQPVDIANYYTTTQGLFGIYSEYGECRKTYYAFKAFAELFKETPLRIPIDYDNKNGISILAACNESRSLFSMLLSNFQEDSTEITIHIENSFHNSTCRSEFYLVDDNNDLEEIDGSLFSKSSENTFTFELTENSVVLFKMNSI